MILVYHIFITCSIYKRAVLGTTILSNGEGHFGPTDQHDQTGQSGPPSELVRNFPVRPNWNGPFHLIKTNWNFQNFGLNGNKAPLDSSLWRILRFTSRLHKAYLPKYFQLCLLKFCHTVDQFNKWTSPKTVENKNPCGVQTWLTVNSSVFTYFQNILCGSRKYPYPHHGGNWKFGGVGEVRGPRHSRGEGGLDRVNFKLGVKIATYWSGKSVSKT